MVKILQKHEPLLRDQASTVAESEFGSVELRDILADMSRALLSQDDGVAIAAPQIGISKRIFLISRKVFAIENGEEDNASAYQDKVFINPTITKLSKETEKMEEGCLSVRYLYGKVRRSKKAMIEAYDARGKKFKMGASGIIAQIFQHEVDHLDGILFIDKATDVEDLPPRK
jgi:peptide deformylase